MKAMLTFDSVGLQKAEIELPFVPAVGSRILLATEGPSIRSVPDTVSVTEELVVTGVGWDTRTDTLVVKCCELGKLPGDLESPEVDFD